MASNIIFDNTGNIKEPTLVLANRNANKLGVIHAHNITFKKCLNTYSEISFIVHKIDNGAQTDLWDEIEDFKFVWCKDYDIWFEITVEVNEENSCLKKVSGKTVCEAELSQVMLYDIEINTEDDIARDDYDRPTVFYNMDYPDSSLLNRITEKVPHYSLGHIDATLTHIQKTFSFSDVSLYDALQEISEEVGCLFVFESNSTSGGKINRTIKAYDLYTTCNNCGFRGEFVQDCPECGSHNLSTGSFGEDTGIFISVENLANNITYTTNADSIKNCMKLEAGDDLMTAVIRSTNPNGSDYLWHISDDMRRNMSPTLQSALTYYDGLFAEYQDDDVFDLSSDYDITTSLLTAYNNYYNSYKDKNSDLSPIRKNEITNYVSLMEAYYNTIDMALYLESGMMPTGQRFDDAEGAADYLTANIWNVVYIPGASTNASQTKTAQAIKEMTEAVVSDAHYTVDIDTEQLTEALKWYGNITLTNIDNEHDTYTIDDVVIQVVDYSQMNYQERPMVFLFNKLNSALKTTSQSIGDIGTLFSYSIDDGDFDQFVLSDSQFRSALTLYCLDSLKSIHDACQTVINILIEYGAGSKSEDSESIYQKMYLCYRNRLDDIESEISVRNRQINNVLSLQDELAEVRDDIHDILDFNSLLKQRGVWEEFCSFRREDKYSNENYISDGLNNAELFQNAKEFINAANVELYKSAELQHTISSSLQNLLVMREFDSLTEHFEVGNWLRLKVDDRLYLLRLLEFEIDYSNLENINVVFSDVYKIRSGSSDLRNILNQAKKMTTSYDSVKHQAKKGDKSYNRLEHWVDEGLNVTNTNIVNTADNNQMSWDEHGILMREYDPITETYSDKQVKITNKGLYVTDDNWRSARVGVGNFIYFNPKDKQYHESYGVIADTLVGNLILGKEVGIYTTKNDISIDENGLIISNAPHIEGNSSPETKITIDPTSTQPFKITYGSTNVMRVSNDGTVYIDNELNVHNNLTIDNSGNIVMDGSITLDGDINIAGNIDWGSGSGVVLELYSSRAITAVQPPPTPNQNYTSYNETVSNSEQWHKRFDSTKDKWVATSFDGGNSWTVEKITFLTHISSTGLYTGTIGANNIYGGHISTSSFDNADTNNDYGYLDLYKQMIFFNENDTTTNGVTTKGNTKMAMGFLRGAQYNEPIIIMGAGDKQGNNVAYINKGAETFDLFYYGDGNRGNANTKLAYIRMKNNGAIRINGVDFPATSSTDTDMLNLMDKAADWNAKLDGVKSTIRNVERTTIKDGNGATVSIPAENLSELFSITGSTISLKSNVVISWKSDLEDDISSAQSTADSAVTDAADANDAAVAAQTTASTVGQNLAKLANGEYTDGTFISGTEIASPRISGGVVVGGAFWNSAENAYIKVGAGSTGYGDFALYVNNSNTPRYQIYDEGTSMDFKIGGTRFMYSSGLSTYPTGTWNFSNSTVTVAFA